MATGCFAGDVLVLTKDGQKRIDEVQEGEYVFAKATKTGETGYKKVLQVYIKGTSEFIRLKVEGEEIRTTSTHLFFMEDGNWKAAENINPGDKIVTSGGELKEVTAIEIENLGEPERIYNLNVEDYHTYFVGASGLLVHNNCSELMTAAYRTQKPIIKTFTHLSDSARQCLFNAAQKGWVDVTKWTGNLTGELIDLTEKELKAIDRYMRSGNTVHRIAESTEIGVQTCDFLVDGLKVEFKGLTSSIQNCMEYAEEAFGAGGKNADKLLFDATGLNLSTQTATSVINDIKNALGSAAKEIEFWLDNGVVIKG